MINSICIVSVGFFKKIHVTLDPNTNLVSPRLGKIMVYHSPPPFDFFFSANIR